MRCYEFYVAVLSNPLFCEDKSDRTLAYIYEYIDFMKTKGVKFDKTPEDKELFKQYQDEFGSEKAITQPKKEFIKPQDSMQLVASESNRAICLKPEQPLRECAQCGMGSRDTTEYKGKHYCPSCLKDIQYKPEAKPIEHQKIEATTIKLKDTWEQRKATMTVPVSKMEEAILFKLEQKGVHPEVQQMFCLHSTIPDYYFPQQKVAVYLDGEVHKGREDRDETMRELLAKRYNIKVVTIPYEGASEVTEDEIVKKILEEVKT